MYKVLAFLRNEDGATAIQYGLIVALISFALLGAIVSLGGGLDNMYDDVSTDVVDSLT